MIFFYLFWFCSGVVLSCFLLCSDILFQLFSLSFFLSLSLSLFLSVSLSLFLSFSLYFSPTSLSLSLFDRPASFFFFSHLLFNLFSAAILRVASRNLDRCAPTPPSLLSHVFLSPSSYEEINFCPFHLRNYWNLISKTFSSLDSTVFSVHLSSLDFELFANVILNL